MAINVIYNEYVYKGVFSCLYRRFSLIYHLSYLKTRAFLKTYSRVADDRILYPITINITNFITMKTILERQREEYERIAREKSRPWWKKIFKRD